MTRYYLSQSPAGAKVNFLQKVYSEAVIGHRHDVWDVHTSDGRWWVITNPPNLYSQEQFPNMDLAVTFHMGLCLRIPRTECQKGSDRSVMPFGTLLVHVREISEALGQAQTLADYQSIGVRSREALLAFIAAAQDAARWTDGEAPKRADFKGWSELICNTSLAGSDQRERRRLIKKLLEEAWVFTNWLTHSKSATWQDAEAALSTVQHALGLATNLVIRQLRGVPEQCPECRSPHLYPEEGLHTGMPQVIWERPVCMGCGWAGEPVPDGERSPDEVEQELITREGGGGEDECSIMTVPLMGLKKPGDGP